MKRGYLLLFCLLIISLLAVSGSALAKTTVETYMADDPLPVKANSNYLYAELDKKSVIIVQYKS